MTGDIGACVSSPPVPEEPPAFVNSILVGTRTEPGMYGWQLIVVIFVVVLACAAAAFVLYWASHSGDGGETINFNESDYGGGSTLTTAQLLADTGYDAPDNNGATMMTNMDNNGGTFTGGAAYDSVSAAGPVGDFNCPYCGKNYNFQR